MTIHRSVFGPKGSVYLQRKGTGVWSRIIAERQLPGQPDYSGPKSASLGANLAPAYATITTFTPDLDGILTNGHFTDDLATWSIVNNANQTTEWLSGGQMKITALAAGYRLADVNLTGLTIGADYLVKMDVVSTNRYQTPSVAAINGGNENTSYDIGPLGFKFRATATTHTLQVGLRGAAQIGDWIVLDNVGVWRASDNVPAGQFIENRRLDYDTRGHSRRDVKFEYTSDKRIKLTKTNTTASYHLGEYEVRGLTVGQVYEIRADFKNPSAKTIMLAILYIGQSTSEATEGTLVYQFTATSEQHFIQYGFPPFGTPAALNDYCEWDNFSCALLGWVPPKVDGEVSTGTPYHWSTVNNGYDQSHTSTGIYLEAGQHLLFVSCMHGGGTTGTQAVTVTVNGVGNAPSLVRAAEGGNYESTIRLINVPVAGTYTFTFASTRGLESVGLSGAPLYNANPVPIDTYSGVFGPQTDPHQYGTEVTVADKGAAYHFSVSGASYNTLDQGGFLFGQIIDDFNNSTQVMSIIRQPFTSTNPGIRTGGYNNPTPLAVSFAPAAEGPSGIAGVVTQTLAAATSSSAATLPVVGTSSTTLAAATSSSAAALQIKATGSATLAAATSSSAAALAIAATGSTTLAPATLNSQTSSSALATMVATLAPATTSLAGTSTIAGTGSPTLVAATSTSAAALSIVATGSPTLAAATATATGSPGVSGIVSATLAPATGTGTGLLTLVGNASSTLAAATTTSAAALAIKGTIGGYGPELALDPDLNTVPADITLYAGASISGGKITFPNSGTPLAALQKSIGAANAGRSFRIDYVGSGWAEEIFIGAEPFNGEVTYFQQAAGVGARSITFNTANYNGLTIYIRRGSSAPYYDDFFIESLSLREIIAGTTLAPATSSAQGTIIVAGSGILAATLAPATTTSAATLAIQASGSSTLAPATTTSVAALPIVATGSTTLAAATSTSVAVLPIAATSSTTLAAATGTGTGISTLVGTSATTLAPATSTSAAALQIKAASSTTLAPATSTATGGAAATGTSTSTLAPATSTSAAALQIKAASSITLAAATGTGTGISTLVGTSAATLAPATTTSAAVLQIKASGTTTLAAAIVTATAVSAIQGVVNSTLAAATTVSAGLLPIVAVGSTTLAPATLFAYAGAAPAVATVNVTLAAATATSSGISSIAGTGSPTLAAATSSSAAALSIAATGSPTLAAATSSSAAGLQIKATGSPTLAAATSTSVAALSIAATGSPALAPATSFAQGGTPGSGAYLFVSLAPATSSGSATLSIVGSGVSSLAAATTTSAAGLLISATGAANLSAATTSSSAILSIKGLTSRTLNPATSNSAGVLFIAAGGSPTLSPATVFAEGGGPTINASLAALLAPATTTSAAKLVITAGGSPLLSAAVTSSAGVLPIAAGGSSLLAPASSTSWGDLRISAALISTLAPAIGHADGQFQIRRPFARAFLIY